jgi:CTP:molybdopterin cytidylyltransferase MocA
VTVLGVVLAAGDGSRFGGRKLLADFRGRPLVRWAVEAALDAGLDEVAVVTGGQDLAGHLPEGVTEVPNPRWADGQATSLQAGIAHAEAAGHDAVVVGLGDSPLVGAAAWRAVAAGDGPVVTASFDGRRRPPVRFAREVWPLLPTDGDEGARALLRERPDLVTAVPCAGDPVDVDTEGDLRRWS